MWSKIIENWETAFFLEDYKIEEKFILKPV
jgi:hypothetical protein